MSTEVATTNGHVPAELLERVLITGDISRLTANERLTYYEAVCKSVGLNPLTRPFDYLTLNGKTILYAKRDATDQLRSIHHVSMRIVARERLDEVYVVTASATMPDGRTDESIGAVSIGALKGEALANAFMKAETKAKRRVTLSICGLGMLDETEVDTIPGARVDVEPTTAMPVKQLPAPAKAAPLSFEAEATWDDAPHLGAEPPAKPALDFGTGKDRAKRFEAHLDQLGLSLKAVSDAVGVGGYKTIADYIRAHPEMTLERIAEAAPALLNDGCLPYIARSAAVEALFAEQAVGADAGGGPSWIDQ